MWILSRTASPRQLQTWANAIKRKLRFGRFKAMVYMATYPRSDKLGIRIDNIRLRRAKPYCGAHPGPCPGNGGRRVRTYHYLEGLDWVAFIGLVNDVLDTFEANCRFFSFNRESREGGRYYLRRGRRRRIGYPYERPDRFAFWTNGTALDFENYCGRRPPHADDYDVDRDTPGLLSHRKRDEAAYLRDHAEHH